VLPLLKTGVGVRSFSLLMVFAGLLLAAAMLWRSQYIANGINRIVGIAATGSNDLLGLMMICVAAGLIMVLGRRRRARGRRSSS
jgi:hypothetical protein